MYNQERLRQPPLEESVLAEEARAVVSSAGRIIDRVRYFFANLAEPFRGQLQIESLDPKVRANLSAKEKGISDAYLHGVERV